jgi:hypothetical protein
MKKLDEYINLYNKNLDLKCTSIQNQPKNPFNENYEPSTKIGKIKGLSLLSKILISALVSFTIILTSIYFLLPVEYIQLAKSLLESEGQSLKESKIDKDSIYYNIKDLVFLELSDIELEKIGIIKKNDSIIFETEYLYQPQFKDSAKIQNITYLGKNDLGNNRYILSPKCKFKTRKIVKMGYDTNQIQLVKNQSIITYYRFKTNTIKYEGWDNSKFNKFAPVSIHYHSFSDSKKVITYRESHIWNEIYSPILKGYEAALDTMGSYMENSSDVVSINKLGTLSKLIPIKITIYNKNKKMSSEKTTTIDDFLIEKTEVILWYVPTEEFLNALPERYGLKVRNELQIIDKIEKGEISTKQACKELGDEESILGICLNYHKNLEIKSIYPSPGREDTHIKFENGKEQKLSVYLFDMSGKEVKCVADKKLFSQGEYNLWVDLSNINPGIYIAVIIDEEGNSISSKLIKE